MPADEICIVGRKLAEEVVKRSFQKRGRSASIRRSVFWDTVPTGADRSDSVLRFLKTPIALTVGATNYLKKPASVAAAVHAAMAFNRSRRVAFISLCM
jgi:hypothetical protein